MSSPVGLTMCLAVILPLALGGKMACVSAVVEAAKGTAVRAARTGGDDAARATGRVANGASGYADDVAKNASRAGPRVSTAVWSRFTQSLDDAVAASTTAGRALASASSGISPRALETLRRAYMRNQSALEAEISRANEGGQSDSECTQAIVRIQKITEEQAAITRLIEKMG